MKRLFFTLSVILCGLSSCAPGLGTEVEVTALPNAYLSPTSTFQGVTLGVKKFSDERREKDSIQMNDRRVTITGDLGTIVQGGLVDALKQRGATLCQFNCPILEGDILDWSLQAHPKFPATEVTSKAKIVIRLVSTDGKVLYTGTYTGSLTGQHPYYSEDRLMEAFGTSMNEALRSAVSDSRLAERAR